MTRRKWCISKNSKKSLLISDLFGNYYFIKAFNDIATVFEGVTAWCNSHDKQILCALKNFLMHVSNFFIHKLQMAHFYYDTMFEAPLHLLLYMYNKNTVSKFMLYDQGNSLCQSELNDCLVFGKFCKVIDWLSIWELVDYSFFSKMVLMDNQ